MLTSKPAPQLIGSLTVIVIHQKHHGVRQVIGIEKLPQRRAGAPDDNLGVASRLGRMEFADEGGQDMAG